jgi:hypothetical protein
MLATILNDLHVPNSLNSILKIDKFQEILHAEMNYVHFE